MDVLTIADASKRLRISTRQAQRLANAGTLTRVAGNLVTSQSVVREAALRHGSPLERAWADHTAWAAIALLSGRDDKARSIGQAQRSRLRARLTREDAATIVALARNRATIRYLEGHRSVLQALRERAVMTDTGGQIGELTARRDVRVNGYFTQANADRLCGEYSLRTAVDHANIVMRVTDYAGVHDLTAHSDVLAAFDLAESGDPRERATGLAIVDQALATLR